MCVAEARLLVIGLLCQHAVEADVAAAEVAHSRRPNLHAVAPASRGGMHDVLPEETEPAVVCDAGDARHGLAVHLADEEAMRVGREEGRRVVDAGVPAFEGGPRADGVEFLRTHSADGERFGFHVMLPSTE